MIEWPEKLVESIARRKCVLFLGSGISANAENKLGRKPATWENFLKNILKKYSSQLTDSKNVIEQLINEKDYLTACEIIVDVLGETDFGECAADEFRRPGYQATEIHQIIYGLDSKLVLTPNIDKIYEQYAMNESNSTIVAKSYHEDDIAKYLRTNDYLIIRVHGCVDVTSKLIFTHKQYSLARCHYASFYRLLDALILTHTFIFLGCGINDPDIQLMLENSNFLYPQCLPHYFITAKDLYPKEIERSLLANRNLQMLMYDNLDGTHSELLEDLKRLNQLVDEKREEIRVKGIW